MTAKKQTRVRTLLDDWQRVPSYAQLEAIAKTLRLCDALSADTWEAASAQPPRLIFRIPAFGDLWPNIEMLRRYHKGVDAAMRAYEARPVPANVKEMLRRFEAVVVLFDSIQRGFERTAASLEKRLRAMHYWKVTRFAR